MKREQVIKKGMRVRVKRAEYHCAVFGAVGTVLRVFGTGPEDDAFVRVVCSSDCGTYRFEDDQFIELQHLTPTKKQS